MKTYRLAQVIDPQCWFAHEGSLDPLEGRPSPLWQWRCLLVLRLERNPYWEEQKLNYWSKIHLWKWKARIFQRKKDHLVNFKNLVKSSKKYSCRARSTKNGATNSIAKLFFFALMTCMQPATYSAPESGRTLRFGDLAVIYTLRYVCAWYPHCNVARSIYFSKVRRFPAAQLDCVKTPLKQLFM